MENTKINYYLNNISKKAVHLDCSQFDPNDIGDDRYKNPAYSKECRLFLKAIAKEIGGTLVPQKGRPWKEANGIIAKDNRFIYVCFPGYDTLEDVPDVIWQKAPYDFLIRVMYRDQETASYYSKGRNQWTSFAELPMALTKAFERAPIFSL
jgi:hypothetical protein